MCPDTLLGCGNVKETRSGWVPTPQGKESREDIISDAMWWVSYQKYEPRVRIAQDNYLSPWGKKMLSQIYSNIPNIDEH